MPSPEQNNSKQKNESKLSVATSTIIETNYNFKDLDINKDKKLDRPELISISNDVLLPIHIRQNAHTLSQTNLYNSINRVDFTEQGITEQKLSQMLNKLKLPAFDSPDSAEKYQGLLDVFAKASLFSQNTFENSLYLNSNSDTLDIEKLKNAEVVVINSQPITKDMVNALDESTKLKKLVLNETSLYDLLSNNTDRDGKLINILNKIDSLSISETEATYPLLNEVIPRLTNLRELEYISFNAQDISKIFKNMPNLEKLSLSCKFMEDKNLAEIGNLSELRELKISESRIGDESLKHISNLKNLEKLDLSYSRINGKGLGSLLNIPLKSLDLTATALDEDNLLKLKDSKTLEEIILRHSGSGNTPNISENLINIVNNMPSVNKLHISQDDNIHKKNQRNNLLILEK